MNGFINKKITGINPLFFVLNIFNKINFKIGLEDFIVKGLCPLLKSGRTLYWKKLGRETAEIAS